MKKLLILLVAVALCLTSFSVSAKSTAVKVKIAPFYTEIDYMSVDNRYVEYPLITYKDITYFPMTYSLCTRLGLMCGYEEGKGLFITREAVENYGEAGKPFGGDALNSYGTLYDAVIPEYPIYLNGVFIDNKKEEYPLLNFRGVTYFPMTWRFAYEELNFDIEWSDEKYSFKLYEDGKSSPPYPYAAEGDVVKLQNQIAVYDESPNEYGDIRYHLQYTYYVNYDFDTKSAILTRTDDTEKWQPVNMPARTDTIIPTVLDATVSGQNIYAGDTLLLTINGEERVNGATVREYNTGSTSVIHLSVQTGNAPAPYTQFKQYFFIKDSTGIRQIPWNEKRSFSGIYPDNKGGFYVASNSYRPAYSGRWSNSFSEIYYYTPGMDAFKSILNEHSDIFNSMRAIGTEDGKLYFLGMWYDADKEAPGTIFPFFSAVNSGYYTLDFETGEVAKLYPYICGETFFGPDKNLYCITNSSRIPKIVNLNTGAVIPIE